MDLTSSLEFESLDEVVLWAKEQIEKARGQADEEVIKFRRRTEEAERKLTVLLDEELARVRQRTETETRAAHASHVASLELDLTELRSALATHEGAAKKRETELMLQRDEALGQVAALKRELIALSELRDKAERARREIETRYQTAAEVSTAAKATEERATAEAAQLRTESATLRAQLDTESAQRSAVESELIKVQSQVQLLTNSMAKAITDRDAMAQRLKEAEYRAAEAEAVAATARRDLDVMQRTAQELAHKVADADPRRPAPLRPPHAFSLTTPAPGSSLAYDLPLVHTPSALASTGGGFGLRAILQPVNAATPSPSASMGRTSAPGLGSPPSAASSNGRSTLLALSARPAAPGDPPRSLTSSFDALGPSQRLSTVPEQPAANAQFLQAFSPCSTADALPQLLAAIEEDRHRARSTVHVSVGSGNAPRQSGRSRAGGGTSGGQISARDARVSAALRLMSRAPNG